jgi:hypothetical protein
MTTYELRVEEDSPRKTFDAIDKISHYEDIADRLEKDPRLTSFKERIELHNSVDFLRNTAIRFRSTKVYKLADKINMLFKGVRK